MDVNGTSSLTPAFTPQAARNLLTALQSQDSTDASTAAFLKTLNSFRPSEATAEPDPLNTLAVLSRSDAQNASTANESSSDTQTGVDALASLATLSDDLPALTAGLPDPTSSTFFQAHLGGLAGSPQSATAGVAAAEEPERLQVAGVGGIAAASPFGSGHPLSLLPNQLPQGASAEPGPGVGITVNAVEEASNFYSPRRAAIGTQVDIQG